MMPFETVFKELAEKECLSLRRVGDPDVPDATFRLRELYCADRGCDCRRVLFQVWWAERRKQVATINYGFEQEPPPFEHEPRIYLDPLNPQTEISHALMGTFETMIASDSALRDQLVRHYTMWKAVVDNPRLPRGRTSTEQVRLDAMESPRAWRPS